MARLNECILYRDFEHGEILDKNGRTDECLGTEST